jgi:hypothetical protein
MKTNIAHAVFSTALLVCLYLACSAQALAQRKTARKTQAENPCTQITNACKAAGFTAGGGKGSRLRKDCVEPILQGQAQSAQIGRALPTLDPAIVDACRSGQSTPVTSDISVPPSMGPGGVHLQLPPRVVKNSDGLLMSDPQPLFSGPALGMKEMPDQQTPILLSSSGLYQLFVTGLVPGQKGGVVGLFTTPDLTQPSSYQSVGVVLTPPVANLAACKSTGGDSQAAYVGLEAVIPTDTPQNLVGFYIADQKCGTGFYGQLGFATATQDGASWICHGPTLRAGPPNQCGTVKGHIKAFNQPTVIKVGNYYYAYFAIPSLLGPGIAVARAQVGSSGTPGSWQVMLKGQWSTVSNLTDNIPTITAADLVVPMQGYVTMPWVSYNTYLKTYLMTMVTRDGFYYSKLQSANMDTQQWTAPQLFEPVPGGKNWVQCQVTWENVSFVTPGSSNNVTGKDGYVVLSTMPGWGCPSSGPRSFALASYGFGVITPPPPPPLRGLRPPPPRPAPCRSSEPCQK